MTNAEWIPIKKELPKESGGYLVSTISGDVLIAPYDEWQADFGYWSEEYNPETGGKVGEDWQSLDEGSMSILAWMPLPEPYKGEEA